MNNTKFTRDEIAQWVSALRSGQYAQTRGLLRDKDGYCCLGVLASVTYLEPTEGDGWETITVENSNHLELYTYIQNKFENEHFRFMVSLMEMNDRGNSFEQIADHIEAYYANRD